MPPCGGRPRPRSSLPAGPMRGNPPGLGRRRPEGTCARRRARAVLLPAPPPPRPGSRRCRTPPDRNSLSRGVHLHGSASPQSSCQAYGRRCATASGIGPISACGHPALAALRRPTVDEWFHGCVRAARGVEWGHARACLSRAVVRGRPHPAGRGGGDRGVAGAGGSVARTASAASQRDAVRRRGVGDPAVGGPAASRSRPGGRLAADPWRRALLRRHQVDPQRAPGRGSHPHRG